MNCSNRFSRAEALVLMSFSLKQLISLYALFWEMFSCILSNRKRLIVNQEEEKGNFPSVQLLQ